MKIFLKVGAYIWHPLLMPLLGTLFYFLVTPRYVDPQLLASKIIVISILTIGVPLVIYFLLRNLQLVNSIRLEQVWERKIPLMIQNILLLAIIKLVFDSYINPELYFFFVGILFSSLSALLLVFMKTKASLHQMGISGVTFFAMALSIHFQVNMIFIIACLLFANGWVASSRLYTKSHTMVELVLGFFLGVVPQVLMLNFWL